MGSCERSPSGLAAFVVVVVFGGFEFRSLRSLAQRGYAAQLLKIIGAKDFRQEDAEMALVYDRPRRSEVEAGHCVP